MLTGRGGSGNRTGRSQPNDHKRSAAPLTAASSASSSSFSFCSWFFSCCSLLMEAIRADTLASVFCICSSEVASPPLPGWFLSVSNNFPSLQKSMNHFRKFSIFVLKSSHAKTLEQLEEFKCTCAKRVKHRYAVMSASHMVGLFSL